mgnify:CR=1 FL=1|jgi:DNA-binding MarR family transcriptional regulator
MRDSLICREMASERMAFYESLKAIFLHIDNHEKAFLSQFNLSIPRFYALLHIHNHPGINYIDLSDLMLCTKSNTTRVVQGMQKDGLVVRKTHPSDRRSFQLSLTESGSLLYQRVYPEYLALVERLMSLFSDEELERYTAASKYIENTLAPSNVASQKTALRVENARPVSTLVS